MKFELPSKAVFLSLVFLCSLPVSVYAQEPDQQWGVSGNWTIRIASQDDKGCYMESLLDDGTLVQFGIAPDRNGGFFAAYNANWTDIAEGQVGALLFDFGPTIFGGEFVGRVENGRPGGYAFFNNPEFVKEFGKRNAVSVKDQNAGTLDFKLTGTMKAINAVRNCDAEQAASE